MTPRRVNTLVFHSYQQLPHLRLGPFKGFLSCVRPSMALDLPRGLLPEDKRIKDTITLGPQDPGPCQKQLTQTLIVSLLKIHVLPPILDFEKSTE